jgi:MATE family multidrug resistance protein
LGKYSTLGAVGVWLGLLAGLTAAAIFLYLRFHYLTKKLVNQATLNPKIHPEVSGIKSI